MERDRGGRPRYPGIITPAEQRVLEELRKGGTNAEIAVRLGIGPETVKTHISSMLAKLGLDSRQDLAHWRPREERRRFPGFLALPGTLASLALPLRWLGVGLATATALVVAAVVLVVLLQGDGESPEALVPTPAAGGEAAVDDADLRYVRDLCVAGDGYEAARREAAAKWGVDWDTGEGIADIPDAQLRRYGIEVRVEPWRSLTAALEKASPPAHAQGFHTAAVEHRVKGTQLLDELVRPSPGLARHIDTDLWRAIFANEMAAPSASVDVRRLLFRAARDVPECAGNGFLRQFLGGGEPTVAAVAPSDEQYLRDVCLAGRAYDLAVAGLVSSQIGVWRLAEAERDEAERAAEFAQIDSLSGLWEALQSASPPDDVREVHLEYLDLLDRATDLLLLASTSMADINLMVEGLFDRVFLGAGDPVAPAAARARLLAAAENIEECGRTDFPTHLLGRDE